MKYIIYLMFLIVLNGKSHAQSYITMFYDQKHFEAVTGNHVTRTVHEIFMQNDTKYIENNLDKINQNIAKVVLVKNQIYNSLVNVNEALKDGREIIYIGRLITEIADETKKLTQIAVGNPLFVAFAEKQAKGIVTQSLNIYNDINNFVLKGSKDLLMNYNTRDELLKTLTHRLQLLRAEIYTTRQAIYWAKMNGLWHNLNPFNDWINQDKEVISDIIWKANYIGI